MHSKTTLSAMFAWFILRPRALRRFLGRNADIIMDLLKVLSTIGGMLFWPGVIFWALGNPIGLTLLSWFLGMIICTFLAGFVVGVCKSFPDNERTDHKWWSVKRGRNVRRIREQRKAKTKVDPDTIVVDAVVVPA